MNPQPQLPSQALDNLKSTIRAILIAAAVAEALKVPAWLVAHGWITNDIAAQIVGDIPALIVSIATLGWSYFQNWWHARNQIAAGATGNPHADFNAPETQAKIAAAIADSHSPITAKT